jgi:outer membrane protein assembly factor BamA
LPIPRALRAWLPASAIAVLFGAVPSPGEVRITVSGNEEIPRRRIEAALDIPERPGDMDESEWEAWTEDAAGLLSDLYRETGYFDAAFRFEREGPGGSGPDAIGVFVREGERYRFGAVGVESSEGSVPADIAGGLRSREGRAFDREDVFADRRLLLGRYGDGGFLRARITEALRVDTLARAVHLRFLVDPGHAVVFDTLVVRNLREGDTTGLAGVTRASLLRSLLGIRRGDTVSQAGLGDYERRLRSTRVFNYVRIRDSLLEDGRSALILSTEERVPGEMDVSAFYETQYGPGVGVNWFHGNILGLLHEGRLGGSLAQKRQNVYLGYASPLFFGTGFRFDNDLVANWYQDSRLQEDAGLYEGDFDVVNTSRLSRALTSWSRFVGSTELRGLERKTGPGDFTRDFTLNFINSMYFSFLDQPVNPARGVRWSFTWGNGGTVFDKGDIRVPTSGRHNWLEGESAVYLPLHARLGLALRLDGGRFFGDGGSNSDRFFLGGPRSVRSFGWRELCPARDDSTGVCSQEGIEPAYLLGSIEVRAHPFSSAFINPEGRLKYLLDLQVVPFVDYGNVWQAGKSSAPEGRGRAFGLGLRYSLLSIFNVRLDFAVDGLEMKNRQWVLDLAQAF